MSQGTQRKTTVQHVSQTVGVSVDLLEEENSAESLNEDDSEWDYDERPLTQPSLKRSLQDAREIYRTVTWQAPPAPEGAAVNQDFSNVPQPFKRMCRPRYPPRHTPRENTCSKCSREIFVWRPLAWWCPHSVQSVQCTLP